MFTGHHIAKGFAAALLLTLIGSAPALAKPMWNSAAPIEYLQYDLTPYFNLAMGSSPAYRHWRPNSWVKKSPYRGLFDYAPGAVGHASPMVEAARLPYTEYVPYIGYDLTPYYNLASDSDPYHGLFNFFAVPPDIPGYTYRHMRMPPR
jgi:hypothetical protein